jgi:hypothetical protein
MHEDAATTARPRRRSPARTSPRSHPAPGGAGFPGSGTGPGPVPGPRSERAPAGPDDLSRGGTAGRLAALKAVTDCPVTFAAVLAGFARWAATRAPLWEGERASGGCGVVVDGGEGTDAVPARGVCRTAVGTR